MHKLIQTPSRSYSSKAIFHAIKNVEILTTQYAAFLRPCHRSNDNKFEATAARGDTYRARISFVAPQSEVAVGSRLISTVSPRGRDGRSFSHTLSLCRSLQGPQVFLCAVPVLGSPSHSCSDKGIVSSFYISAVCNKIFTLGWFYDKGFV